MLRCIFLSLFLPFWVVQVASTRPLKPLYSRLAIPLNHVVSPPPNSFTPPRPPILRLKPPDERLSYTTSPRPIWKSDGNVHGRTASDSNASPVQGRGAEKAIQESSHREVLWTHSLRLRAISTESFPSTSLRDLMRQRVASRTPADNPEIIHDGDSPARVYVKQEIPPYQLSIDENLLYRRAGQQERTMRLGRRASPGRKGSSQEKGSSIIQPNPREFPTVKAVTVEGGPEAESSRKTKTSKTPDAYTESVTAPKPEEKGKRGKLYYNGPSPLHPNKKSSGEVRHLEQGSPKKQRAGNDRSPSKKDNFLEYVSSNLDDRSHLRW